MVLRQGGLPITDPTRLKERTRRGIWGTCSRQESRSRNAGQETGACWARVRTNRRPDEREMEMGAKVAESIQGPLGYSEGLVF